MTNSSENSIYVSCDMIEHGLDTNINAFNFCCRSVSDGGGFKTIMTYTPGQKIDWDNFFAIKRSYREQMKKGNIIPECVGCLYLKEQEWDNEDYISYMNFNSGTVCNCKCIYCYLDEARKIKTEKSSLRIVKDLIDRKLLKDGGHITIAGGEPTITPDFDKMLNLMINSGLSCIRVLTNGIKYSKSIEKGLKLGVMTIVISVDSGTKETYKKVKRVDAFDAVWKNLKKYAPNAIHDYAVKAKYIILPRLNDSRQEFDAFINKVIDAGIKEASIDYELNWFNKNKDIMNEYQYEFFSYAINRIKEAGLTPDFVDRGYIMARKTGFLQ